MQCKLCPVLGNFERGEAHSVVVMDNVSIHCGPRVREMIETTGAVLVMTAPYSPDLNPWMTHELLHPPRCRPACALTPPTLPQH